MATKFTHLHLHTEYSMLDGLCNIEKLVEQTKAQGMDSLALTDHGNLHGAIQFYSACQKGGVKPIIGIEGYLTPGSRHSRTSNEKKPYHITLLAKDLEGYRNLIQLTTKAHTEGFYYRPRMDRELLEKHQKGLIAFTGCANGEVPRLLLEGRHEEAAESVAWYQKVFGEDFFAEVQYHQVPELIEINKRLLPLARERHIPLVATNDVHYIHPDDHPVQDVLLCIQTGSALQDEKRMRMSDNSYYLASPQQMADLFAHLPEAVVNTQRIADRTDLRLEFDRVRLPRFQTPNGETPEAYLRRLAWEGCKKRYRDITDAVTWRLQYELDVIEKTQFANYFLVVGDIAAYARRNGIFFGVRGSAAASLVLYCLGITDIDPLKYRLVFERFLNVERKEMPDVDMDFQDDRRYEVINYVTKKYGNDHVAQIITFGTLKAKAAVRDVGRAMGLPYSVADRIARLIPGGPKVTLDGAVGGNLELKEAYQADPTVKSLLDMARRLEGVVRNASTHAAGVVISEEPLTEYVPLQPPKGEDHGVHMTQFAMEDIAKLGLLKMDFLGLDNFTILTKAREIIKRTRGKDTAFLDIPLQDKKTFDLLSSGETTGLFQLESPGMRRYIKELKPASLNEIAAMIALYRPGPMEHIPTFIEAKHGRTAVTYPHPALADILNETYGVIVYQDQILLIAQTFAGYTLGEADILRKAMGKKIPEVMRKEKDRFIAGAVSKGYEAAVAQQVWDLVEPFAGYAFNKAHSFSYGVITYWTAYFKANYPVEYMAAVMAVRMGSEEKIAGAAAECARLGIKVLPPSANKSQATFALEPHEGSLEGASIRFGLAAVKNVGESAVKPLVEEREQKGLYRSVEDFCRRIDTRALNRRALESLIKVGALDELAPRGKLLGSIERLLSIGQREAKLRETGQTSMFDLFGEAVSAPPLDLELAGEEVSPEQCRAWEKEYLGVYLTAHPIATYTQLLASLNVTYTRQVEPELEGKNVTIVGVVNALRHMTTKDGRLFAIATLEDLEGTAEVAVWPDTYAATRDLWIEGATLLVRGRVRVRDDRASVSCDRAERFPPEQVAEAHAEPLPFTDPLAEPSPEPTPAPPPPPPPPARRSNGNGAKDNGARQPSKAAKPATASSPRRLQLTLRETDDPQEDRTRLMRVISLLKASPGRDTVRLNIDVNGRVTKLDLPDITTDYSLDMRQQLAAVLGEESVPLIEE